MLHRKANGWRSDSFFFFSSRRRHTRCSRDWSSDVCSSDLFQRSSFYSLGFEPTTKEQTHSNEYANRQSRFPKSISPCLPRTEVIASVTEDIEIGRASCRERV